MKDKEIVDKKIRDKKLKNKGKREPRGFLFLFLGEWMELVKVTIGTLARALTPAYKVSVWRRRPTGKTTTNKPKREHIIMKIEC